MKKIIIILISLVLMSSTCKNEGEDCHRKFTLINKSNQDVMVGLKFQDPSHRCSLTLTKIKPDSVYEFRLNECWESSLANGQTEEFYIVAPNHHNVPLIFYDCDSIEIKNTVLKHYVLTLYDLRKMNWLVTYP